MNDKKFCFIICSNQKFLAEECQRYISKLEIPSGYQAETIVIYDAKSMTSGYNRAMEQSDAKYKIYLHQDVLLLHTKMLYEILDIFQSNPHIGMMGMVGNNSLDENGCPWSGDTDQRIGEIYGDLITHKVHTVFQKAEGRFQKVITIDGLMMITQYDIPWREDILKGWDFYDGSQSLEFWKAGYSVVVPYMNEPWCIHDNDILHMQDYEMWRKVFEKEYRRYYQNRRADMIQDREKLKETKPVIYQIFHTELTRYSFPYPPIYKEKNADYICFTNLKNVKSKVWKVVYRPELSEDAIRQEMSKLPMVKEIHTNEIQIAEIFCTYSKINPVIRVPAFTEFPDITFDLKDFVPTHDKKGNYIYKKNPVYKNGTYNGREFMLTIGMPVSNQIDTIDRCLSHIKPLLDELDSELLIIDTGSTDGTIDICKKYGARIIEFPWCNDMSAARNQGIYHARGEWYMSLDDDEWFEDVSEIVSFFQSGEYQNYDIAAYVQRNYSYQDEQVYTDIFALRMARITPEIHFEGRIHDALSFPEGCRGYQFHSYVHHYGFVMDNEARRKEKYKRNVSGLLYDIWETPEDLLYNYQLCQEFLAVGYYEMSYAYCFLGLSVEEQIHAPYYGRLHAARLMSAFYYAEDEGVYDIMPLLKKRYQFTDAEKAYFSYILADLGVRYSHNADEVLENLNNYEKYLKAYEVNEAENQRLTYVGLDICTNIQYKTDAQVMAFSIYAKSGDIEHAVEEIDKIQPEYIWYKKYLYIEQMLYGLKEIYQKIIEKITVSQLELWMPEIIQSYQNYQGDRDEFPKVFERFSELLRHFSIQGLDKYINKFGFHISTDVEQIFMERVMNISVQTASIQELHFHAAILKQKMMKVQAEDEHMSLFGKYVEMNGKFAELYYHPSLLQDGENTVIAPEVKASYEIYLALQETSVNAVVLHLKNALMFFPGFKKEIQVLLDILSGVNKK